jgi:hypothetical protein
MSGRTRALKFLAKPRKRPYRGKFARFARSLLMASAMAVATSSIVKAVIGRVRPAPPRAGGLVRQPSNVVVGNKFIC